MILVLYTKYQSTRVPELKKPDLSRVFTQKRDSGTLVLCFLEKLSVYILFLYIFYFLYTTL